MDKIYFDNSATTKISKRAKDKMIEVMDSFYGNPSSLHEIGFEAEKVISSAKDIILRSLGIYSPQKKELIFTSGGTESNNLAIFGVVNSKKRQKTEKIMITNGEHSSVENCAKQLEKEGYQILRVPTIRGELDLDYIEKNSEDVILASFMHVNNETGALYDIGQAFDIIRKKSGGVVCHADCVQSYAKVKSDIKSLGADLVSLSGHKINAAKGIGALYVSPETIKAKKIVPIVYGGGQEFGFRSGTENVYGIASFGEAAKEHFSNIDKEIEHMREVREYLISQLSDHVQINNPKKSAPHILNITINNVKSETMLHYLESFGIYVSSGSACTSNSNDKTSKALLAFGLNKDQADSSIRISLSPQNTIEEADYVSKKIIEGKGKLAKKK